MSSFLDNNFVTGNLREQRKIIADICNDSPMFNVIARRVKKHYLEDQDGHWLADFATQSYLGLDFREEVIDAAVSGTQEHGTVVACCHLVATLDLFEQAEDAIAKLTHSENCNIFAISSYPSRFRWTRTSICYIRLTCRPKNQ